MRANRALTMVAGMVGVAVLTDTVWRYIDEYEKNKVIGVIKKVGLCAVAVAVTKGLIADACDTIEMD